MQATQWNFSAGPSQLPQLVLESLREATDNCEGSGFSLFELNHRSDVFLSILEELKSRIRSLLSVPDNFDILFCPGGASLQFAAIPMNLCTLGFRGGYIVSGFWSLKAYAEADRISRAYILWNGESTRLPEQPIVLPRGTDYVYYCDNETIDGKEFPYVPPVELGEATLVSDMSSNIFTRPIDWRHYGCVFASLQKNLGIAGASLVIVDRSLYGSIGERVPAMMNWERFARQNSLPNTAPVAAIYSALLMTRWIESEGGLAVMQERAQQRSSTLYGALDEMRYFYTDLVPTAIRSRTNVVFNLPETLTIDFLRGATEAGLHGLKGHRARGGLRASLYNAMPQEGVEVLVGYLKEFCQCYA